MASYNFTWDHPASEVYVTGTFDNWQKSVKLEKDASSSRFQKEVSLPEDLSKIHYKFVVDGQWVNNRDAPSEADHEGNVNNVLTPEHLLSSAAPGSSTAALAGQQPLEKEASSLPGTFPETPAAEYSVNPIPQTSGASNPVKLAPGEPVPHPSTYTDNTVNSTARDESSLDESAGDQSFGISPIPATGGAGNPISLRPGEAVPPPETYTSNTLESNVKHDQASYENASSGAPVLPPVLDKQEEAEAAGASMFGLGAVGGTMIPESSLPMGGRGSTEKDLGPTISSAGPTSTTAQLAGAVPLEPRGGLTSDTSDDLKIGEQDAPQEVVNDKERLQDELLQRVDTVPATTESGISGATAGDEAPGESDAPQEVVADKEELQSELKDTIPEAPATSESGPTGSGKKSTVAEYAAGGVAAVGATAAGLAYSANERAKEKTGTDVFHSAVPTSVQSSINNMNSKVTQPESNGVPEVVAESQQAAGVDPEASAQPEAVATKSALEAELTKEVPKTEESGTPAPTESAALSTTAPGLTDEKPMFSSAGEDVAAGLNPAGSTSESTPATNDRLSAGPARSDSRDISPSNTTGIPRTSSAVGGSEAAPSPNAGSLGTPPKSATRTADNTASPSTKQKNRKSFFGKLKEKFK